VAPRDVGDMHDTSLDGGCGECVHVQNEVLWPIDGTYMLQLSVPGGCSGRVPEEVEPPDAVLGLQGKAVQSAAS